VQEIGEISDVQLVASIARYSELALTEVYRRYGGAVYGLARRILNSAAEAEDVTQDVFLRLWKEPDRFDASRGSLRSFLLARSHARAVDVVRAQQSRALREATDAFRTTSAEYDMEQGVWDLAMAEHMAQAMAALPDHERWTIEMAYFEGRTYKEVAELLGQPEGTVKSRVRAGMRHMRAVLVAAGIQGVDA
jgi:RNA polymerase sigma-70 factor (ECF subfamily)